MMLPSAAMPSAAPTSRVTSFTAEPTPDFASGTDPTIELARGRHHEGSADPDRDDARGDEPVDGVDVQRRESHEAERADPAPDAHDRTHAEPSDDARPAGRKDHERDRVGQLSHAGLER